MRGVFTFNAESGRLCVCVTPGDQQPASNKQTYMSSNSNGVSHMSPEEQKKERACGGSV
jgi:hypothetical protein